MRLSEIEKRQLINNHCKRMGLIVGENLYPGIVTYDEIKMLAYRILELIDGVDLDQYRKRDSNPRVNEG